MLIAISKSGNVYVASEPRKMMALANGLAVAGLPKVSEMLKDGDAEPIWNQFVIFCFVIPCGDRIPIEQ